MALWDDNLLNDQTTGEIDLVYINVRAEVRAAAIYGTMKLAPREIRESANFLQERAMIFRRRIRAKLGLSDDTEYVAMPADLQRELSRGGVRREV